MSAAELLALAERVEAATGADREIDCWIENRLGLARFVPDRPAPFGEGWLDKRVEPKPYTASLDAAMALVPEGLWRRINVDPNGRANVRVGSMCAVTAATPALALCAAALRARAAEGGAS